MKNRVMPLVAVAAAFLAACSSTPSAQPGDLPSVETLGDLTNGEPLPQAELSVLGGEGVLNTADLRGTPVVLNFWATWCPFCIAEMPDFEAVNAELGGAVRFIGIDEADVADKAVILANDTGVTYELVEDPDESYFRAVKGRGMPTTVLVDADGIIRWRHSGPLTGEQLRGLIAEHLGVVPVEEASPARA